MASVQNRWGVEDIVRYLDDLLIVTALHQEIASRAEIDHKRSKEND